MAPGKSLLPNEGKQEYNQWTLADEDEGQNSQRLRESAAATSWANLPPRFYESSNSVSSPQAGQNLNANNLLQQSLIEQAHYFRSRPLNFGIARQPLPFAYHQDASHHQAHQQGNLLNQSSLTPSIDRELVRDLYRLLEGSNVGGDGGHSAAPPSVSTAGGYQFQHCQQEPNALQPMYASLDNTKNRTDLAPIYASGQDYNPIIPALGNLGETTNLQQELLLRSQGRQFDQQALLSQFSNPSLFSLNPDLMTQPLDRLDNQFLSLPPNPAPPSPPPPVVVHKPVLRALSAYNFFFRDERDRIVDNTEGPYDTSEEKKKQLLEGHWHRDRTTKRRHRRTHGKIAFTALSKVISKRWKDLEPAARAFYRDVAADDLVRYHRELDEQKASISQGHLKMPPRDS